MKKSICVILAVVLTTFMVSAQQYNHPRFTESGTQHFNFSHPDSIDHGFNLPGDPTPHSRSNPNLKRKNTPSASNEVLYRPTVATVDTLTYYYTYDAKGNLLTDIAQGFFGPIDRLTYTYDGNGNTLTIIYEINTESGWAIKGRTTYTYDSNGNLLTELEESLDNIYGSIYRTTYTYDINGNLLTRKFDEYRNGDWVHWNRSTYTYDNNGNQLTYLYENYTNRSWVPKDRYTYTYDDNGNRLSETYEDGSNGGWQPKKRETYTYNSNGHRLSLLYEHYSNGAWVMDYRETYTYNSNGHRLSLLYEHYSNGAWVMYSRGTYTYDSNGHKLSETYEGYSNGAWVMDSHGTYTYDSNGHKLSETYEGYSNGALSRRHTYNFDNNGNLLTEKLDYYWNGAWSPDWRHIYTFDNYGNCVSGKFEVNRNSNWVVACVTHSIFYNNSKDSLNYYGSSINVEYTAIALATSDPNALPETITLNQNYPNPFNPATAITFSLPSESFTSLKVYNTLGEHVQTLVNGVLQSGVHNISFDATNLPSGVYVYRLDAGDVSLSKKMMLMK